MSLLTLSLLSLKLGFYVPSNDAPIVRGQFYLSSTIPIYLFEGFRPELGFTEELKKEPTNPFDLSGSKDVYLPTYFLGVTHRLTKHDLNVSMGAKVRNHELGSPYVAVSLRFDSIKWNPYSKRKVKSKQRSRYVNY